ncbi:MAG: helix-turn-helix domain-containing protein [Balneolaceae bacterium]
MAQESKQSSYVRHKTKQAYQVIIDDLSSIPDVQTWAEEAGVSTRWLSKAMKKEHGKSPKVLLRKQRYTVLVKCLTEDPELKSYYLAREIGLSDEKALYKLLSSYYDTTLTELRDEIIEKSANVFTNAEMG